VRTFRRMLHGPAGRALAASMVLASLHAFADPQNYLFAIQQQRAKEQQIREIAAKLNVDPEFLLHPEGRRVFDFRSLFAWAKSALGIAPQTAAADPQQPLDVKAAIGRVKSRYGLVAADATLGKIADLVRLAGEPAASRAKKRGQIRAEVMSLLHVIDKDFLPPVPDAAPGIARQRDAEMRTALHQLTQDVKHAINGNALDDDHIDATLAAIASVVGSRIVIPATKRRWTRDPLPLRDTYKTAPKKDVGGSATAGSSTPAIITNAIAAPRVATNDAVPADVAALAAQLQTPAKIFTWAHDNLLWESYSGVAKGSSGTLAERRGNDWDQALLLRDLLAARGYQAQLEWGRVMLPVAKAMNLAGTDDPLQAANLMATGGLDGVILMNGSTPVGVELTHAWVRALIPYVPNRGATDGTADTWVRMDPSFKRFDYQPGIAINGKVVWNEDEYFGAGLVRAPEDVYGDKIWSFIRANNLSCQNLAQVARTGSVHPEGYPFVPSTLTARIDGATQTAAAPPSDQLQSIAMTLTDANGATIASWSTPIASVWGKKVTLTFPPASADDAAIINSYGGIYNTPAYLVRLMPVVSVDDVAVAQGAPLAAGAALDLNITFHQPNVADDFAHHDVVAGETHALVLDPGALPDSLLASRIDRFRALAPGSDASASERLFLVGLRYMQHADEGLAFAAGVRWQRSVKRVFEADVRQQIHVAYNVSGSPLRLSPAEENIDVSRLAVGIVPINNDLSNRAETLALAGLQSSYLEGAIWEEMQSQQGISAAKALLLARRAGQTIYTVDAGNLDSVLASVSLASDVEDEIRASVAQGRIAKIAASNISVNRWSGTGYILRDPSTGAATYPISGNLAGGSTTGEETDGIKELLGSESWLDGSPLGDLLRQLLALLGGGGDGSNDAPSTTQSDPVNLSSGNMYRTFTDVSVVARGIPVALARTYNSRSAYNGPFGYGWTFNYGEMLVPNGDGSMTYREADGTEHLFAVSGGAFVSPPGKHLTLTPSGSGWTMRFKDGMQFTFDGNGLLTAQTDLNGNTVTINHDANGHVTSVVDASGRTVLTFTWSGAHITQLTDVGGRTVVYTYSGDDLVTVTDTAGKPWTMAYDTQHNMTALADPLGNTQSYDYDGDDRLMHHIDAAGAEEFFQYDIAGRQSVITDRRGGDRLITYDDEGRATLEADPAGNVVKASFDADNNRTNVIDSRGNTTAYVYDAQGNVTQQTNPDGGVISTEYDANARPLKSTDAVGVTTTNNYDASGNLLSSTKTVSGVSQTTTNAYDSHGQLLTTTDANNGSTSMTWNDNGTLATRTDAANNTTTMTSDPLGRITAIKDPANNTTSLTYDAKDRILTMTDPYGNQTAFAYDDAGRRTSVTTPRGTTTYAYDPEGRVVSVRDPLGEVTRTAYDAAGDVLSRTDARGNVTRYEYDLAGRVTKMTDANGGVTSYAYCASLGGGGGASCSSCGGGGGGTFCQLTDPNGNTIKQGFDVMGRVVSVTDSLSHAMFTEYDKAGRKTVQTDANGNATRYRYDEDGRMVAVIEASGAVTQYTYDANGNKLTQKDANGNVWTCQYDALNRLKKETDPLGRSTSYTYDAIGNLKTKTDAKGQLTTYTYNVRRVASIAYADGVTESFTYDAIGRRTGAANGNISYTYGYDALNRIVSLTNGRTNFRATYDYDATGNQANRTTYVNGSQTPFSTTQYVYDAKNRLTSIKDSITGTFAFAYDAMDRRTSLAYPNGATTSYAYDNAYRLTAMVTKSGGAVVDAWSYQYDAVGNRLSKTDMNGTLESYQYDAVDRLTKASYGDGTSESFTYDAVGNRLTRTDERGLTTTYSYDIANQLLKAGTDTFTYDNNGNLLTKSTSSGTTTLAYNARNLPLTVAAPDGTETNIYGPMGERMEIRGAAVENGDVYPEYDLAGNPYLDTDSGLGVWIYRVYGPGVDEPLAEWRRINNRITYLHHDALGSVTAVTNTAGQLAYRSTYKAFGQMSRTGYDVPTTRLGYTSRETSVGGLMQYRSRYYDPSAGRFLQQDSFKGESVSPPSLHRYVYTVNRPTVYIDPSGRSSEGIALTHTFAAIIAMTATVGMITAAAVQIADGNGGAASMEMQSIVGYFSSVVGMASIFVSFEGIAGAFAALGLGVLSSASLFSIIADPGSYTHCEVEDAWYLMIWGMMITVVWSLMMPGVFIEKGDEATALEYLTLAAIQLLAFGLTLGGGLKLDARIQQPWDERVRECRNR
jgi:RHS repeat-associated protein